jgi:hypothetical protein
VRVGAPCAGEATAAVAEALRGGRVADAFVLINSVLHTYNPQSPYIALEEWYGGACADCGAATDPDEMYRCEDCEAECCEGCIRYCHACERNCCAACVEHDAGGDRRLCAACRAHCSTCGDVTAQADVDEAGRCPSCAEVRAEVEVDPAHENQLLPHEQETEHDSNQRESEREHPHAGDVSEVPVPAAP